MASRAPSASTRSGSTLGSRRGRHRRGRAPAGWPGVDGRARRHRDGDARRQPANGVGRGAIPPDGGAAPGEDPPHGDRGGATRPRRQGVDHLPARRIVGKLASDRRARSTRQATGAPIAREEVRGGPAQKRRRHGRRQTRIPAAGLNGAAPPMAMSTTSTSPSRSSSTTSAGERLFDQGLDVSLLRDAVQRARRSGRVPWHLARRATGDAPPSRSRRHPHLAR